MTDSSSNRRAFLRFPMDALVWWNRDWEPEPISLIDLSAGGMLVEFPNELGSEEEVELHFEFPGYSRLILCTCRVAHCRKAEGPYYRIGLRIVQLDGMEQSEFIARLKNGIPTQA